MLTLGIIGLCYYDIKLSLAPEFSVKYSARKSGHRGFLVVQWLRLASNAGGLGLIPGQGTRSHRPQLRVLTSQLKRHEIAKLTGSQEEGEGGRESCSFLAVSALPFFYHCCWRILRS